MSDSTSEIKLSFLSRRMEDLDPEIFTFLAGIFSSASVGLILTVTTSVVGDSWRFYVLAIPWTLSAFFSFFLGSALSKFKKEIERIPPGYPPDQKRMERDHKMSLHAEAIDRYLAIVVFCILVALLLQVLLFR
jgi:hypothetical protein